MAYTIISQNNTTTTLSDENGNVITVPARVTLATSTDYTIIKVNNNSVDLEDGDGKIIRGVPACVVLAGEGGGGASYTAGNGIDIDANNEISVTDPVLVNNATGSDSLSVLGGATTATRAIAIGKDAAVTENYGIAIGSYLTQSEGGIALGQAAQTNGSGIAIGHNNPEAKPGVGHSSIAIGLSQKANVAGAIQIGTNPSVGTNSDANTFKVSNENGNYEIMSADGTIPADRLTHAINKYSTMPTASASNEGWIVQFTGTTDSTYTHGHLYECVSDGGNPATYSWTEVQLGGGGASYTAGTGIDITSGVISVAAPTLVNSAVNSASLNIGGDESGIVSPGSNNTLVGKNTSMTNFCAYTTAVGDGTYATSGGVFIGRSAFAASSAALYGIAIGQNAGVAAQRAIQLGAGQTNSDANTFKVANANGNFEMMNANGNLPADRLASTTGLADGNYRLRLTMASGVPTLSWVAE